MVFPYSGMHKYSPPGTFPLSVLLQPGTEIDLIAIICPILAC